MSTDNRGPEGEELVPHLAVREVIAWAARILAEAGVSSERVDAEILLAHVLGVERADVLKQALMGHTAWDSTDSELARDYSRLIAARAQRVPLQHLTKVAHFRRLTLNVGPGVFVPRPETEIVVQVGIDYLASLGRDAIAVDLCTGSGAIALAMATELPASSVYAVELSHDAFAYTVRNNQNYGSPVHLVRGDARTALSELNGSVDAVVSNPPYVPSQAIPKDLEVALHDPELALYGLGDDGLEIPRGVTRSAARLLTPGGIYVMEHAEVQGSAAREMVRDTGYFDRIETQLDLTNRPRMVVAYRNNVAYVEGFKL